MELLDSSGSIHYSVMESRSNLEQNPAIVTFPRDVVFGNGEAIGDPNMTVAKLMEAYDECLSRMREYEAVRRSSALKYISPVVYTTEGRRGIAESTIEQIVSLNSLDAQLHRHAQQIFEQRQQKLSSREKESDDDDEERNSTIISSWSSGKGISLGAPLVLVPLVCAILLVIARLRASKLKNQ